MKTEYLNVFAAAVRAKMTAADAMHTKTTWSTRDHLRALTELLDSVKGEAAILDVLQECYNISAFQQTLAKAYKTTGHFQRTGQEGLESVVARLQAAVTDN